MQRLYNGLYLATFLLSFFVLTFVTPVWGVGLEQGESNSFMAHPKYYTYSKYSAVTQRWGYAEAIIGSWYGESYGRFVGLSAAYTSPGKTFYDLTFGGIYLIDYSGDQLDGRKQFTFTIGVGQRFDDLSVSIRFRHISNGARFYGDNSKNKGIDFILFNLQF